MSPYLRLLSGPFALAAVLLSASSALGSAPGSSLLCEEEQSVEPDAQLSASEAGMGQAGAGPAGVADTPTIDEAETILPCAMAESGQFGPWCVEAKVYVVTQKGTLLCRVLLPNVDMALGGTTELHDRPLAPTAERPQTQAPSLLCSDLPAGPVKPAAVQGAKIGDATKVAPAPLYSEPPFVPG